MKNSKHLLLASVGVFALGTCGVLMPMLTKNGSLVVWADPSNPYTLTLNSDAKPTLIDGSGSLVLSEYVTLNYTNAADSNNYHVVLNAGGTITKTTESRNLTTITAVFDGDLQVETDYESTIDGTYLSRKITSGSQTNIYGNYWRIVANAQTSITSIEINYGCGETATTGNTGDIGDYDNSSKGSMAGLTQENGDVYLWFAAYSKESFNVNRVNSETLTIRDDNQDRVFPCERIVYDNKDHFKAYFNLTEWYQSDNATGVGTGPIYGHAYIDGVASEKKDIRRDSNYNSIPGQQMEMIVEHMLHCTQPTGAIM